MGAKTSFMFWYLLAMIMGLANLAAGWDENRTLLKSAIELINADHGDGRGYVFRRLAGLEVVPAGVG